MPCPRIAIAQEQGPLRAALEIILQDALVDPTPGEREVIGLVIPLEPYQADWADQAATILRRHPKCKGLVVAHGQPAQLHKDLRPSLQNPFQRSVKSVEMSGKLLAPLLSAVQSINDDPPTQLALSRAREVVFAKALYKWIVAFGHGGTRDLTNQVLAPLRMLRKGQSAKRRLSLPAKWKAEASKLLESFRQIVLPECADDWWLPASLRQAFDSLPPEPWNRDAADRVALLEQIMDLLTECRQLAGVPARSSNKSSAKVGPLPGRSSGDASWCHEVLVIDDHAESWRPVFKELQARIARGVGGEELPVTFEFITGGEDPTGDGAMDHLLATLPDYDAVLLDVYLNPKLNGMKILEQVRRHYVNLPVIVWTSSVAPELPAAAQLAHGFLFKKIATLDDMATLLADRIREGNAKRRYPIPGHFFDHSIRSRSNRKTALRFAEYGLKQMDSFHALDEEYFRFFTDHGGRHLFKLLEHLENLLRPLINDRRVFSEDDGDREQEILALYLAVFLHEFGMLNLKDRNEPGRDTLPDGQRKKETELVRALHALRGIVMIADPKRRHWPDEEGQYQARKRFSDHTGARLAQSVAAITGYHSRLLPIDETSRSFCKWSECARKSMAKKCATALGCWDENEPDSSGKQALEQIKPRFFSENRVRNALVRCTKGMSANQLELLRRHCALFRFADAIDADYTRNPADFLSLNPDVSALDLREALKRQVIRGVKTEGGKVVFFSCVPCPEHDLLDRTLNGMGVPGDLAEVWSGKWTKKRIEGLRPLQKKLDDELKAFWKKPLEQSPKFGLQTLPKGRLKRESKLAIARLTALSVAWEVVDEYEAIINVGLGDVIGLKKFEWGKPPGNKKLEAMLSMLFHPNGLDRLCVRPKT